MANTVSQLFDNVALRRTLFKGRFLLTLLLLVPLAYYMVPRWWWLGLAVSMFGQFIQVWCFASLVKNRELTVRGPYLMCRNPMYVGRYFMMLGFVLLLWNPWIVLGFTLIYWLYMTHRVKREERRLRGWLGDPYIEYCKTVHPYIPSFRPIFNRRLYFFDMKMFNENNAHWNILGTLVVFGFLYLLRMGIERL